MAKIKFNNRKPWMFIGIITAFTVFLYLLCQEKVIAPKDLLRTATTATPEFKEGESGLATSRYNLLNDADVGHLPGI